MLKLIVSDFDGTLMPYGNTELSENIKAHIMAAKEQGITFAVSSGRTYGELLPYFRGIEEKLWFICCDGAYYVNGDRIFYEKQIARADLELFFRRAGTDFSFVLHGAKKNFCVGDVPFCADGYCAERVKKLGDVKEKIFKITSYGGELVLPEYSGLRMHWDGGADAVAQYVNRFCDKGAALSDLQMRLMLTKFDTACLGDGGNDIAMMKNAKYAISVGNRSKELASVCNANFDSAEAALGELMKGNI